MNSRRKADQEKCRQGSLEDSRSGKENGNGSPEDGRSGKNPGKCRGWKVKVPGGLRFNLQEPLDRLSLKFYLLCLAFCLGLAGINAGMNALCVDPDGYCVPMDGVPVFHDYQTLLQYIQEH